MIDGGAVDEHQEDDVGSPKDIRNVIGDRRSSVTQRNALVRRTVPDSERMTGTAQIKCHRLSHGAETDEPDLHVIAPRDFVAKPILTGLAVISPIAVPR